MQSELEPVRAAAKLFREYAQMHADKYEPFGQSVQEHAAITAKVERNAAAAQSLEDWLNAQPTPPAESAGLVERLAVLRAFLDGSGEIDGLSFGDSKTVGKVALAVRFWWRSSHLPVLEEAAHHIASQDAEIARLNALVSRVQSAAKTIMIGEADELRRLREQHREWHLAIKSLDSEREANAILTAENEALRSNPETGHD